MKRFLIFVHRLRFYIVESWRCENAIKANCRESLPFGDTLEKYPTKFVRMAWWRKLPVNVRAAWRDAAQSP